MAGAGAGAGGAAAGGLLAGQPAAAGPGWPVPVCAAGDAARLRGGAAGRGRGGRRGGRGAGRVRAGGGRAGRGGAGDQYRRAWPRPAGWMPRTPRCGRCWPGRWGTTRPWRGGWRSRWRSGGSCAAGRGRSRCCARLAGQAEPGSDGVVRRAALARPGGAGSSADLAGALGHFTAVRDAFAGRGPSTGASRLPGRPVDVLANLGRLAEAAEDGRRALAPGPGAGLPARRGAGPVGLGHAALDAGEYTGPCSWPGRSSRSPLTCPAGWPGHAM